MAGDQADPFVVRGKVSLPGLPLASIGRVRAFYGNWTPLPLRELFALSDAGMDLLEDRGRWLAWSETDFYDSLTVLPRRVRPSALWNQAVSEAQASLARRAEASLEELRGLGAARDAAKDDHLAAERRARASGRLWGRWTNGHRAAVAQAAALKSIRDEARDRAEDAYEKAQSAKWLADQLEGRTQIAANVMARRWTGQSCVGLWEDPLDFFDVQKIAAAQVVGQVTVGLMLGDLISDDTYGRLLEPWHASTSRVPWQADPATGGDLDAQAPAVTTLEPTTAVETTREPSSDTESAEDLTMLLEVVRQADGMHRILYRDQVAAFGRDAVSRWRPG